MRVLFFLGVLAFSLAPIPDPGKPAAAWAGPSSGGPGVRLVSGPVESQMAQHMNNLALHYMNEGQFDEAENLFHRCLGVLEEYRGPEHPQTGIVLTNLGELYRRQKRFPEADKALERSLTVLRKDFGENDPYVAWVYLHIANLRMDQKKYKESNAVFLKTIKMQETVLGPDHPYLADTLRDYSRLLEKRGWKNSARKALARSESILAKYAKISKNEDLNRDLSTW